MADPKDEKERRRAARIAEQQAAESAAARRRRLRIGGGAAVAIAAIVAIVLLISGGGGGGATPTQTTGAASTVVLGTTQGEAVGATVDGIQCQTQEQVLFHIHAHLAVFVDGRPGQIPEGIGIAPPRTTEPQADGTPFVLAGSCFYWLHSHTNDGVIHIESPDQRTYTLGNYFDIWHQPLSATQVAQAKGPVTAYLNGRPFTGDPRSIPLSAHAVIQLDVGTKVAPQPFAFPAGL
jgi:hypothetical protein